MSQWATLVKELPEKEKISEEVVERLCRSLLGEEKFDASLCSRHVAEAIWSVLVTATREKWTADEVEQNLNSKELAEKINNCLKKYGEKLRSELHSIRWDYPEVVDVEWSVSKTIESRDLVKIGIPSTSITLHAVPLGKTTSEPIRFDCDPHQLQDLHWKVKEALNAYKNLKDRAG